MLQLPVNYCDFDSCVLLGRCEEHSVEHVKLGGGANTAEELPESRVLFGNLLWLS